jgi:hypothetical protein
MHSLFIEIASCASCWRLASNCNLPNVHLPSSWLQVSATTQSGNFLSSQLNFLFKKEISLELFHNPYSLLRITFLFLFFKHRVSLGSPDWPQTHSLCNLGWPGTHNPPVSASWMLRLQAYPTTHSTLELLVSVTSKFRLTKL